eukprot:5032951-Pyramimonas_sp.AAC.1
MGVDHLKASGSEYSSVIHVDSAKRNCVHFPSPNEYEYYTGGGDACGGGPPGGGDKRAVRGGGGVAAGGGGAAGGGA